MSIVGGIIALVILVAVLVVTVLVARTKCSPEPTQHIEEELTMGTPTTTLQQIAERARAHADEHPNDLDYRLLAELAEELVEMVEILNRYAN